MTALCLSGRKKRRGALLERKRAASMMNPNIAARRINLVGFRIAVRNPENRAALCAIYGRGRNTSTSVYIIYHEKSI
jgi:hypothetical protein